MKINRKSKGKSKKIQKKSMILDHQHRQPQQHWRPRGRFQSFQSFSKPIFFCLPGFRSGAAPKIKVSNGEWIGNQSQSKKIY